MKLSKLDLSIELSPSQLLKVDAWLGIFYSKCKLRMSDPVVEDRFLKISSADIYNFLSVIEVQGENRFDWIRLKKNSKECLWKIASRKRVPLLKSYYPDQLEMLEKIL